MAISSSKIIIGCTDGIIDKVRIEISKEIDDARSGIGVFNLSIVCATFRLFK